MQKMEFRVRRGYIFYIHFSGWERLELKFVHSNMNTTSLVIEKLVPKGTDAFYT